jgi:hypothetical protein
MQFLTYDGNGPFTGAYIQDEAPAGESFIEVDDATYRNWFNLSYQDGQIVANPPRAVTPEVPVSVTMRQARLALLQAGKLSAVDATIASLTDPQKSEAQIEWEYASDVQRNSGLLESVSAALGMSDTDLDTLFITASGL